MSQLVEHVLALWLPQELDVPALDGRGHVQALMLCLQALEAAGERIFALLAGDLHGGGHLQQQGMHGIAQLMGRDGEELVARLKQLLQL